MHIEGIFNHHECFHNTLLQILQITDKRRLAHFFTKLLLEALLAKNIDPIRL